MKIIIGDWHIDINDDKLRSAKNPEEIIKEVSKHTGIDKEILSEKITKVYNLIHKQKESK